jgi:hypothetical protein
MSFCGLVMSYLLLGAKSFGSEIWVGYLLLVLEGKELWVRNLGWLFAVGVGRQRALGQESGLELLLLEGKELWGQESGLELLLLEGKDFGLGNAVGFGIARKLASAISRQ